MLVKVKKSEAVAIENLHSYTQAFIVKFRGTEYPYTIPVGQIAELRGIKCSIEFGEGMGIKSIDAARSTCSRMFDNLGSMPARAPKRPQRRARPPKSTKAKFESMEGRFTRLEYRVRSLERKPERSEPKNPGMPKRGR